VGKYSTLKKTRDMPNAKHKEKVKETSDVLKDCREVLHDGSNVSLYEQSRWEIKTNRNTGK
jgi:hypothetical protein